MIKPNEIRIGNFAQTTEGRIGFVESFSTKEVILKLEHSTVRIKTIKPYQGLDIKFVELTEEWLLNFGFKKDVDFEQQIQADYSKNILMVNVDNGKYYIVFNGVQIIINFVHQLQNLNFALTGEELIFRAQINGTPTRVEQNNSFGDGTGQRSNKV